MALYLWLIDQGIEFEAVFVNHQTDYPETYHYLTGFQWWLKKNGYPPVTVIYPDDRGISSLYERCWESRMVPSFMRRWCTDRFKIRPLQKYFRAPAFSLIGIDAGEAKRAKIVTRKKIENRYPLVEAGINRAGCIEIIKAHDLPVPPRSGCFICPFQSVAQWKKLRYDYPDLFCKVVQLEQRNIDYRIERGKTPLFLNQYPRANLWSVVEENQLKLWEQEEYPPCECEL